MKVKILICLLIIISLSTPVFAYTIDDIEWKNKADASRTLGWGGTLVSGDYTIKVEDFDKSEYVSVGIYRDGRLEKMSPLRNFDRLEFRDTKNADDLLVVVKDIKLNIDSWTGNMDDPTVRVEVFRRGFPDMEITIKTEKDSYDPRTMHNKPIVATIDIKNNGDARAFRTDVEIDVAGMDLREGKLAHQFTSIEKNEALDQLTVRLEIPHYWEENDIDITVTARSEDINGDIHTNSKKKKINIKPVVELVVTKSATKEVYMDGTAHVSVSIWNNGIYNVNSVTVSDPITTDLEIQDDLVRTKETTISIGPRETKASIFQYTLKPTKTGTYTIPATTATFTAPDDKQYTYKSETPKIKVEGPDIVLNKDISPAKVNPGDDVTVKVTVRNRGTKDASVQTSETIPDGLTFIKGDLSFNDVVARGKSHTYSYVVRVEEIGELRVPATTASFVDMEAYRGERVSNSPLIKVLDPSAAVVEKPSSSDSSSSNHGSSYNGSDSDMVQPGFNASMMLIALLGVYLLAKRRNRS